MDKDRFLAIFRDAIRAITDERYFSTERGYQGQLISELNNRINFSPIFQGDPILEQEYQKTLNRHGITIRPDLIIHIPYESGSVENRTEGNYIVIQLKLKASKGKVIEDFDKIDDMFKELDYPLGIFLNINSDKTFFENYTGDYKDRVHCFAVRKSKNIIILMESP